MSRSISPKKLLLSTGLTLLILFALFYKINNSNPGVVCDYENRTNQLTQIPDDTLNQPDINKAQPNQIKHSISKRKLRHFPDYLEANEKIRQRFLEKRKNDIFAGRSAKDVALWEPLKGYVWNSFIPLFTCPHLVERIGTVKDGGKWICGLEIFEDIDESESAPCVIYSLGVGLESTFEVEMVKRTPCSVYAYDFSVDRMELPPELESKYKDRIKFFKLRLGSKEQAKNDTIFRTLGQLMKENGHDWIDFLKVDIEGAEFALLTEMNEEFEKIPYGHLNIEIHLNEQANLDNQVLQRQEFEKLFKFWESLESKGLRAWWSEVNYYSSTYNKAPPVVMEYAFINIRDVERNRLIQF